MLQVPELALNGGATAVEVAPLVGSAVLLIWLRDRRRVAATEGTVSIRDNDLDRRAYSDASQGRPAAGSDADRFGGGDM